MEIIIDSTEFKKDRGLNKEDITLIKILGKEGYLNLHIPWFVYKECTSSSVSDLIVEFSSMIKKLNSTSRKGLDNQGVQEAKEIANRIDELKGKTEIYNEVLWNNFIRTTKAKLYQFDPNDSVKVFDAYFKGERPFKSLKHRNDIPDAFIYETIIKVKNKKGRVYVVSGDKNLREKCEEVLGVEVYENLKELFGKDEFIKIKKKYEDALEHKRRIAEAKTVLIDNFGSFEDAVTEYVRKVQYLEFTDYKLPSDSHEATIYAIDNPVLMINKEDISFLDNKFFVPIEVEGEASVDYAVFKQDYWVMEEHLSIAEDLNKHYYLIEDVVTLIMKKTIVVDIEDINKDEILEIEIDEFDEIEIKE